MFKRLRRAILKRLPWWVRALLPLHRVHHIFEGYGTVVFPWWPRNLYHGADGWTMVRRVDYHDCTVSGVY